ncbi:MAG: hypothetical protein AAB875_06320 [Patescibacteria group bacterium]
MGNAKISLENKNEWINERRAKELKKRGYDEGEIADMMYAKSNNIRGKHIRKWLKHKTSPGEMVLNGKL